MDIKKRPKSSGITDLSNKAGQCSTYRKDLICTVCGAPAVGFNFAVITCMCCKAFFRRNALFGLSALQCRYSTDNCLINMKSRRDCSYCRLKKCFDVGMKKELILSEDLKRVKREKILANRQMTSFNSHRPIDSLCIKNNSQFQDIQFTYLTNIYNAYEEYCRLPLITFETTEYNLLAHQPIKSRIKFQHYIEHYHKSESLLFDFFKRLPEFNALPSDQQLTLSKLNIRFVMRISFIETLNDQLPFWPAIHLLLETIFSKILIEETNFVLHQLKDQTNDSICIRLLLVILLFSTSNLSRDYLDTLHIYKIQEKYTELLWVYLQQRYDSIKADQYFSTMIRHCLHMQTIGHRADLKRQEIEIQNSLSSCNQ